MPVAYSNYSQNRTYKKLTMKKTLLLSSLFLALAASSSFADALLFTVNSTPYDRQMARIRPVLTASTHTS
ncbi:MAG: hypothetical protein QOD64_171, partial [Verrucomicrobiota bacterium]